MDQNLAEKYFPMANAVGTPFVLRETRQGVAEISDSSCIRDPPQLFNNWREMISRCISEGPS